MISKYRFIVERFNDDILLWSYIRSFDSLYEAQCSILELRKNQKNKFKYRILEVIDLYV